MSVTRLKYQIRTMNRFEDPPNFLILHIAGNDIGLSKIGQLRACQRNHQLDGQDNTKYNYKLVSDSATSSLATQNQVAMSRCR